MNYSETLNYIHSVSNFFCKPGLERIGELCEKIGNPQNKLKFIHVAGTNGKGSFCAMTASILKEAGYKTGLYTSPYILEFNERIAVNGESISNEELCEITAIVKTAADTMVDKPTEFELITAVAFLYFYSVKCDVVVLECGLGGRYDATNIIEQALVSVITGISIDHTSFLGNSVEEIAGEKAGIIKNNGICLWCSNDEKAEKVIVKEAERKNARIIKVDKSDLKVKTFSLSHTTFDYHCLTDVQIPLLGSFQPSNAANVISVVSVLRELGFEISDVDIKSGLLKTEWKARFEIISRKPLIIADGGHNPEGICAAVDSIKLYFGDKRVDVVTGVMKDKDYNMIADKISTVAENVFCITPDNPRALNATEYAALFANKGINAFSFDDIDSAVKSAVKHSIENNTAVVCLGSLYMYKDVYYSVKNLKIGNI